jgi:hypothetical protein
VFGFDAIALWVAQRRDISAGIKVDPGSIDAVRNIQIEYKLLGFLIVK